jgi:hypothetical protein
MSTIFGSVLALVVCMCFKLPFTNAVKETYQVEIKNDSFNVKTPALINSVDKVNNTILSKVPVIRDFKNDSGKNKAHAAKSKSKQ